MDSFTTSPTPSSMPPSVSVTPSLRSLATPLADHVNSTQYWAPIDPLAISNNGFDSQTSSPSHTSGITAKYYRPRSAVHRGDTTPECVSLLKQITTNSVASSITPALSVSQSMTPSYSEYEFYDIQAHLGKPHTLISHLPTPASRASKNTIQSFALPRAPQSNGGPLRQDLEQSNQSKWAELMVRARNTLKCKAGAQVNEQAILHMFERLVNFAETTQAQKSLPSVVSAKSQTKPKQRGSVLRSVPLAGGEVDPDEELECSTRGIRKEDKDDYRKVLLEELEAYTDTALGMHVDAMANDIDETGVFSVQARQAALLSTFQEGFRCGFIWGVRFYDPDPSCAVADGETYRTRGRASPKGAQAVSQDCSGEKEGFNALLKQLRTSQLQDLLSRIALELPTQPAAPAECVALVQAAVKGQKQVLAYRKILTLAIEKLLFFKHLITMTRTALPSQVDLIEETDPVLLNQRPEFTDAFVEQLPDILHKEGNRVAYALKEACRLKEFRAVIAKALGYQQVEQLADLYDLEDVRDAHAELLTLFRNLQRSGSSQQAGALDILLPLGPYVDEFQRRTVKSHIGLNPTGKDDLIKAADTFLYSVGPERFKLVQDGVDTTVRRHPEILLRLTKEEAYSAVAVFVFVVNYCCKMFSCTSVIGLLPTVSKIHVQLSSLQNLAAALRKTLGFTGDASHNRIIERVNAIALHTAERVGVFTPTEAGEIMSALGVTNVADVIPAISLLKARGPRSCND
ncbi:Hypothetical protein DHA2_10892 [Giardia duodenalis]|uniref:Uncharacterized protein n=1 Tax=Giardia intestinalis TaxID=5741 RepID=V6T9N5_GIAIN|nr:Hypothetical protein DHA2_10892 [Giardia intestinalis]